VSSIYLGPAENERNACESIDRIASWLNLSGLNSCKHTFKQPNMTLTLLV